MTMITPFSKLKRATTVSWCASRLPTLWNPDFLERAKRCREWLHLEGIIQLHCHCCEASTVLMARYRWFILIVICESFWGTWSFSNADLKPTGTRGSQRFLEVHLRRLLALTMEHISITQLWKDSWRMIPISMPESEPHYQASQIMTMMAMWVLVLSRPERSTPSVSHILCLF